MKAHKLNNNHGERIAVLETNMSNVIVGLNDIKHEIRLMNERMDKRFDLVEKRFDSIEKRFDKIETRMWQLFIASISACSTLFYLMAHANKWIGS